MFRKVLIVEDHEMTNLSVQNALKAIGVQDVDYVYSCDHAFTWVSNALRAENPYDLLITDLWFEEEGQPQRLESGFDLILAVRELQPALKIIFFSAENRLNIISDLFKRCQINAYVRKARNDGQYFKQAIQAVAAGRTYRSPDIDQMLRKDNIYEFSAVDVAIIELLVSGVPQKKIPEELDKKGLSPSSLSSVEKKIGHMKMMFGFGNNTQLIAYCKDLGII